MRNIVSELVTHIFSPVGILMLSMAAAFFLRRNHLTSSRYIFTAGLAFFYLCTLPLVSNALYASLESQYPPVPIEDVATADYIVLLGGGLSLPKPPRVELELGVSGDRVLHALRLYKANKARAVIATGGARFADGRRHSEAYHTKQLLIELGMPPNAIIIEEASRNTHENALRTQELITQLLSSASPSTNTPSILLVTSASHMPRAMSIFSNLGFSVTPAATDVRVVARNSHVWRDFLPNSVALARTSTASKEYLGFTAQMLENIWTKFAQPS